MMKTSTLLLFVASATTISGFKERADKKSPEEGDVFEGDMILSSDQLSAILEDILEEELTEQQKKLVSKENTNKENIAAVEKPYDRKVAPVIASHAAIKSNLWMTNGEADIINYYIDPALEAYRAARRAIIIALSFITSNTCIKFQRSTKRPVDEPHLYFYIGTGCQSPVGRTPFGNEISLAQGCWDKGTVMHEIGHSLGFFHEQSRPDRDDYVSIEWGNILPNMKHNFAKYGYHQIDSREFKYDLHSLMHYGPSYFAKDRQLPTIKTKDPIMQHFIGQRNQFSPGDLAQLNKMYNC